MIKNRNKKAEKEQDFFSKGNDADVRDFVNKEKDIKKNLVPDGFSRRTEEYVVLNDGGIPVYVMGMYVYALPRKTKFATTFAPLFNYPKVESNVFIEPLSESASQHAVDKKVRSTDAELGDALDSRDSNRIRKMQTKFDKAQQWAVKIEAGDNSLYNVQFLFLLYSDSEENLYRMVGDFHSLAKQSGIELYACYGLHTEAFISGYPLNSVEDFGKDDYITTHVLDRRSVGDLFNHTSCNFIHQNGAFLGHYLDNFQAFFYDPYDRSHDGFGAIFAGGTGTGKSTAIKVLQSRLSDLSGVRFRTLDIESRASHGEYTFTALASDGLSYDIKANGKNVLNPFDINVEMEFDESTGTEYPVLKLAEKRSYLVDLFMSMVKMNGSEVPVMLNSAMISILEDMCYALYAKLGIQDGQPESLYQSSGNDFLNSGRSKKPMPTITDAFKYLLIEQRVNDNPLHEEAYQTLVDTIRAQVKGVYYGKKSMRFFTREEYDKMEDTPDGKKCIEYNGEKEYVLAVVGSKAYFDGQSTIHAETSTPYINYDISQIPESDRKFAILVVLGYMEEHDIKPNSANPLRALPMIALVDELHILFPYEEARRCIERFYRTARKRWVGPWVATQSLADFGDRKRYPELAAIYENTDTYFLFRHKPSARKFFKENTELTDSQIERVFKLGVDPTDPEVTPEEKKRRSGEVCVIDRGRVAFVKVDYLENTEAEFVETNVEKIKGRYKQQ